MTLFDVGYLLTWKEVQVTQVSLHNKQYLTSCVYTLTEHGFTHTADKTGRFEEEEGF